jgi:hypothetical protein
LRARGFVFLVQKHFPCGRRPPLRPAPSNGGGGRAGGLSWTKARHTH